MRPMRTAIVTTTVEIRMPRRRLFQLIAKVLSYVCRRNSQELRRPNFGEPLKRSRPPKIVAPDRRVAIVPAVGGTAEQAAEKRVNWHWGCRRARLPAVPPSSLKDLRH